MYEVKRAQLEELATYRDSLRERPRLTYLFLELTDKCNLECAHCGSACLRENSAFLSPEQAKRTLDSVATNYGAESAMLCITGGEPLLHPRFDDIVGYAVSRGFRWGMTTNGTLVDGETAARLRRLRMDTVSVSLDGLRDSHDLLRGIAGAFERALSGVDALVSAGFEVQITTVVHSGNFDELDALYALLLSHGIKSWRLLNVEPVGRARRKPELLPNGADFFRLLDFIRKKRHTNGGEMEVTYGCSHFLTPEYERMVRDYYFICGAGTMVASVTAKGDIVACLDIERRRELTYGNVSRDDFATVWEHGFADFRRDRTALCDECARCDERRVCGGDSAHTWDFDEKRPLLCAKQMARRGGEP